MSRVPVMLWSAALLGVLQGLTEFLPVSSSAHLILARAFFGWDPDVFGLAFDIACHVGTLAAVLWYFRADLGPLVAAGPRALAGASDGYAGTVRLIAVGTVPIVIVGLTAADYLELTFRTVAACAVALTVGALGMIGTERVRRGRESTTDITPIQALVIGCGQALALIPGMSRSGTTITIAMLFGIRREAAARFTFLLSVPAVAPVALKKGIEVAQTGLEGFPVALYVTGIVTSGLVGYVAVKYLIRYLANNSLNVFAFYRMGLAAVAFVWLMA